MQDFEGFGPLRSVEFRPQEERVRFARPMTDPENQVWGRQNQLSLLETEPRISKDIRSPSNNEECEVRCEWHTNSASFFLCLSRFLTADFGFWKIEECKKSKITILETRLRCRGG